MQIVESPLAIRSEACYKLMFFTLEGCEFGGEKLDAYLNRCSQSHRCNCKACLPTLLKP